MSTPRQNIGGSYVDEDGNPLQPTTIGTPTTTITPEQRALIRPDWVAYRGYGSGIVGYDKYGRVELRGFTDNVAFSRVFLLNRLGSYAAVLDSPSAIPLDDLLAIVDVRTSGYAGKLTVGSQMLNQIIAGLNAGSRWNAEIMRFVDAYSDPNSIYYRGDTANPSDPNYSPGDKLNDVDYQNDFLPETIAAKNAQATTTPALSGNSFYWLAGGLILLLLFKQRKA